MPYRFREHSLTIGRPGWTRRQVLKMLSSVAPAALVPKTSSGQGRSQSQPAGQITPKSFTRQLNGAKIHYRQWTRTAPPRCCSCIPVITMRPSSLFLVRGTSSRSKRPWLKWVVGIFSKGVRNREMGNKTKTCKVSLRVALSSTSACTRAREANFLCFDESSTRAG
jgi:hypothetical protein